MPTAKSLRRDLAELYRDLARRGMAGGSAGNVSARHGAGMLITASGTEAETAGPDDVVRTAFDGTPKGRLRPSSEWHMHAAIYRAFPEAQAIVHTHADGATALACLGEPLPAFHYAIAGFGGDSVPVAPYATFGTPDLAEAAVAALRGRSACLLANHGMIVHGRNISEARAAAVLLETLCRQYLLARAAGTPRLLTEAEMQAAILRYATYGQPQRDRP